MGNYLKPDRREKLIEVLMRVGSSRAIAEVCTMIPEEHKDIHLLTHAECCADNIDSVSSSIRAAVYVALSSAFVMAIGEEAEERGEMTPEHFPQSIPLMDAFSTKVLGTTLH